MRLLVALTALLVVLPGSAQQSPSAAATPSDAQPAVRFTLLWSQGRPWTNFFITVHPDCKSHFEGTPSPEEGVDSSPFQQDFAMSQANCLLVFELAKKLNYFNGDFETHLKHIAQTGTKTLAYTSSQAHGSASYNWSQNADVQQLTHLFWSISTTFDYGRKLAFQYRFDKLGMDSRLKQLAELHSEHNVEELQVIEPILHKIAFDPAMMHISRETAKDLLRGIHPPPPGPNQASTQP